MDVGAVLRSARALRRLSQRELADLAGVPRSTVGRIEAGAMTPRVDTLQRLLECIGCRLAVQTVMARPVRIDAEREQLRDRGGRHYPAHLPLEDKPRYMGDNYWWGWHHIAWWDTDPAVPEHYYWHPARNVLPRNYAWDDAT